MLESIWKKNIDQKYSTNEVYKSIPPSIVPYKIKRKKLLLVKQNPIKADTMPTMPRSSI